MHNDNNKFLLTIVTVVFNGKNDLNRTVDSVSKIKNEYIEYIIIDGASTDGSIDVIKSHLQHINGWSSEPDSGIYDAMNKGIAKAQGEYVLFLNAGDIINPELKIDELLGFIRDEPNSIYYSDSIQKIGSHMYYDTVKNISSQWWRQKLPCHQCCIVSKTLLLSHAFDLDYTVSADSKLLTLLFSNYKSIKFSKVISIFELGGVSNNWSSYNGLIGHLKQMASARKFSNLKKVEYLVKYSIKFLIIKLMGFEKYYRFSYFIKRKKPYKKL